MDRPSVYPCSQIASLQWRRLKAPLRFIGSESNSLVTAGLKLRGNTHVVRVHTVEYTTLKELKY